MPESSRYHQLNRAFTSLLLIVLVAFSARLIFAVHQSRKIPPAILTAAAFDQETGSIASSLASGKGYSNPFHRDTGPTAWLTPVYPLLVAATFKVLGLASLRSFYFLVFLNILFSTAVCIPLYFVGERVASPATAALATWLWALFPGAIMIPFEWIWDTSLSVFLATLILWATLKLADSPTWRNWCAYGMLWGFTLLTNPSIGALLPFLLVWAFYRARTTHPLPSKAALLQPGLALTLVVLCCLPWTVRNYTVFHRLIPLRSNFSFELYIGNNENYAGDHPRFPPLITKDRETVRYLHMGEIPFMDEEAHKAKLLMQSHPRKVLILFGDRFLAFWTGAPFALTNFLATDSWLVRTVLLWATLSALGALAGIIVLLARRSPFALPLAVYPLVFPLVYYLTHTSLRYRHPIEPVVLLLTAIATIAAFRALLLRSKATPAPQTVP